MRSCRTSIRGAAFCPENRSICLGLSEYTWNPRSTKVSKIAPRGVSMPTATAAGSPPLSSIKLIDRQVASIRCRCAQTYSVPASPAFRRVCMLVFLAGPINASEETVNSLNRCDWLPQFVRLTSIVATGKGGNHHPMIQAGGLRTRCCANWRTCSKVPNAEIDRACLQNAAATTHERSQGCRR